MSAAAQHHLVFVPHSHWDREWYRTHEQFRHRALALLDGVLDLLEGDPDFRHFTLDGQTIVLEDYLEIRPGARERIEKLVRDGRLLVGPWYVLPDEWLVSGEALIRNLRKGLADAAGFGGGMSLGYVPDQFGHVGQLPQLFAGFGFDAAVLWRGVGADVDRTPFLWEGADGTTLFTVYLPGGYGNATRLPHDPAGLKRKIESQIRHLGRMSAVPSLLMMNGDDHALADPAVPGLLSEVMGELPGTSFEIGTLPGFAQRARQEAEALDASLPRHRGELRSGLGAPLLPGCASARSSQKQRDFENDRLLTRYLEPLSAWLQVLGGEPDLDVIDYAWRVALQNHPHDSICGCSIDAVHEQMETRFDRVREVAQEELARVAHAFTRRVRIPRRGFGRGAGAPLVVWNPGVGGQGEADGTLDLPLEKPGRIPRLHLRSATGERIPVDLHVLEEGALAARQRLPIRLLPLMVPALEREISGQYVHAVDWRVEGEGVRLSVLLADAPTGFDAGPLRTVAEELAAREDLTHLELEARRLPRVRLRFVDDFPAHGIRTYRLARGGAPAEDLSLERTEHGGLRLENRFWRVHVNASGSVALEHRERGVRIDDAVRLVSEGDRGDEYNFDPVPGGRVVSRPDTVRVRPGRRSDAALGVRIEARYRVPEGLDEGRGARSEREVWLPATLELRLATGLDRVDVSVELDNRARDHRLRLHLRAPFAGERFRVESAFEVASRPIDPQPGDFGGSMPAELPVGAVPQRSFASLDEGAWALTVASRGLAEVEAVPEPEGDSSLALTLLRAVGWLSRDDLALRPVPAGPMLATPGAQVPGPFRAEVSLRLHPVGSVEETCAGFGTARAFAAPPLVLRAAPGGPGARLEDGERLLRVDDPSAVVSAVEPRRDGRPVLRLYNPGPDAVRIGSPWPHGPVQEVDLRERPVPGGEAGTLPPGRIQTLRTG